ncbi:MAG: DUF11 domain-containing protein, partial [Nanoarchaeota archaeon]|nr:DUF11 domain-containing protein [Nanoarchaeota archaeon]
SSTKIAFATIIITGNDGGGGGGETGEPNLTITKSADPDETIILMPGDIISYTLVYKNTGTSQATEVVITDNIPIGTTYVSNSGGSLASSTVSFDIGTLASNASSSVSFQVKVNDPEEVDFVVNKATIDSNETSAQESNQLSHGVDPFIFTKKAEDINEGQVLSGDIILYTLTVTNIGVVPTTNIIITDNVPTYTAYVAGSIMGIGADDSNLAQLRWNVGSLAVDQSVELTFKVAVDKGLPNNTIISNLGTLNSDQVSSKTSSGTSAGGSTDIVVESSIFKWCAKEQQDIPEIEWSEARCVFDDSETTKWCAKEQQDIPEIEWSEARCVVVGEEEDGGGGGGGEYDDGTDGDGGMYDNDSGLLSLIPATTTISATTTIATTTIPATTTITTTAEIIKISKDFIGSSIILPIIEVLPAIGLAAGGVATTLGLLPFVPSITEWPLFFARLMSLLMIFFGLKKRARPWGTVYNSVTKQPLDPTYVVLWDSRGMVVSAITDIDGRYGFLVRPGKYRIFAKKTNFKFPSQKLFGKTSDELYNNLYFGEEIEVKKEGETIIKNIPLDPEKFDWNEFIKRKKHLFNFYSQFNFYLKMSTDLLFALGFFVTIIVVKFSPSPFNFIVLSIYIFLLALMLLKLKPKTNGLILEKETGMPLSFAIMRIFAEGSDREMFRRVVDKNGKYYLLITPGRYYLKIERKNEDGSYSHIFTSEIIDAKSGIIQEKFEI